MVKTLKRLIILDVGEDVGPQEFSSTVGRNEITLENSLAISYKVK